ncbi:hypothetical protein Pyn_12913 [Prunus yedoensis var. nudiflora]|uniref:Uncharacterized protein n=1 Tax=Prunus yedoensis var. nudiflora TaxID=2094558 RepID=A0A314ZLA9_PRUYE|nr:hypothetical protein Pyn_12913 [Prunus yedoensis var. nudiflora]
MIGDEIAFPIVKMGDKGWPNCSFGKAKDLPRSSPVVFHGSFPNLAPTAWSVKSPFGQEGYLSWSILHMLAVMFSRPAKSRILIVDHELPWPPPRKAGS